ncbi:hypothetical protein ES754_10330 [Psychrobacter frigidicola]|uniref:Uncharacterized protein n=1 Tax=Psychrobacter frigidicola TaxID=45611 RepID=A0A5C6ZZN2_9GAMM|nr:hypothetical protein [Psychrobacter frigidicola]TXD96525.1 hypothetical protein ES754_10330 [Psychrobacter frigidicola]
MDITNLPDGIKPIAIAIIIIVTFVPFLKFLKDTYIDFEMSKFKQIINTKDYEDGLSSEMKVSLMDARDRAVFKKLYGLNLSKKYRDIALKIERQSDVNIDCEDIKKAAHYLEFKNNSIIVNYRPWLIFKRSFANTLGFTYFLVGMLIILITVIIFVINAFDLLSINIIEVEDFIFWVFMGLVYLTVAFDQLKKQEALKTVIKIITQSEKLPNLISVDENWRGKDFFKKLGFKFKSPDEINFEH